MAEHIPDHIRERVRTPRKSNTLVIEPTHVAGDFNSHAMDCPFVFTHEGRAGMTVVGWDGAGYQTGLSWLDDDGRWSSPTLVFPRDPASRYRRYNAALTSILRDNDLEGTGELLQIDGYFYATYHAYPSAGYEEGSAIIGIVRSTNLYFWEEYGGVLLPEEGAAWERGGLYKSWLLRHDGKFWLFYNAKDIPTGQWREQTGVAVSDDFVSWSRVADHPLLGNGPSGSMDERFASDPCVLKYADSWIMFYFGLSTDGHARDFYAVSPDLLSWTKGDETLIDVGPEGSVDSQYAHKPAVLFRNGRLEHYYCAVRLMDEPVTFDGYVQREMRGISVATSVDVYPV